MVNLRTISDDNFDECIKLKPKKDQQNFVAPNVNSLAEAYLALSTNECTPMPYAIYNDDTIVGFVMLAYYKPSEDNPEHTYWICRLMIDEKFQRKGYGKDAVLKALDIIKNHNHKTVVMLSYEPDNLVAKNLYASLGFKETGDIEENEIVAKLIL